MYNKFTKISILSITIHSMYELKYKYRERAIAALFPQQIKTNSRIAHIMAAIRQTPPGFVAWEEQGNLFCSEQLFYQVLGVPSIILPCLRRLDKPRWEKWELDQVTNHLIKVESGQSGKYEWTSASGKKVATEIKVEVWSVGVRVTITPERFKEYYFPFTQSFSTIISYKDIADQIILRSREKASRISFCESLDQYTFNVESFSGPKPHKVQTHSQHNVECDCMLYRCLINRMWRGSRVQIGSTIKTVRELAPLRKVFDKHLGFSGEVKGLGSAPQNYSQFVCHHIQKVLQANNFKNFREYIENRSASKTKWISQEELEVLALSK